MPYRPDFARKYNEYSEEKSKVRSIDEWVAFSKKWFDQHEWPKKTPEQISKETQEKRHLTHDPLGGRMWAYIMYPFDLSPENNYEFHSTSYYVGFRITECQLFHSPKDPHDEIYWEQECPYCAISTTDIGGELCPVCGRRLIYQIYEHEN